MKSFASDNYSGVLPEVMQALQKANGQHARSYGADEITKRTTALFREVFESDVDVFFVFNGTGANVLSISSATQSFNSVLCSDISHIYNDESSAPETFTGCRFFALPANEQGKLSINTIQDRLVRKGDVHYAQASLLSITQSTECGTAYKPEEIAEIAAITKEHGLCLHVDGSRLFNAASYLKCGLNDITGKAGVDILSLGGTKAGMMYGEAVIVFNKELAKNIAYKHKQSMQLASKSRFIAAQFEAMLENELWRKTATHANKMAELLCTSISKNRNIKITKPVQANAVFAEMPQHWYDALQENYPFYMWKESIHEVRLMCSWDTKEEDILGFAAAVNALPQ